MMLALILLYSSMDKGCKACREPGPAEMAGIIFKLAKAGSEGRDRAEVVCKHCGSAVSYKLKSGVVGKQERTMLEMKTTKPKKRKSRRRK